MSSVLASEETPPRTAAPTGRPLSFARLVHVEIRKSVDTVAGRWVLGLILVVTALALLIVFFAAPEAEIDFTLFLGTSVVPQALLLPILGILAATAEWSRRTGLVTFTLEPRRIRVAAAKLLAVLVLGLVVMAAGVVMAALATLLSSMTTGMSSLWDIDWLVVRGGALGQLLVLVQGVGFGMIFGSTPLAIATYYLLPQLYSLLSLWEPAQKLAEWTDINSASAPLTSGDTLTGEQWAQFGTATALWILLPILLGTWILTRRDVK